MARKNKFETQLEIAQKKLNKQWVSLREIFQNQENYNTYYERPFQEINYLAEYACQCLKRKNPRIQRTKINGLYHYNFKTTNNE